MKSESLMLVTTIFACLYFGLMKWITSLPLDGMSFFIMVTSSCMFIAWLITSFIVADDTVKKEDTK
jgi:O-antigen ligase